MSKARLYLAGPMRGYPDFNFPAFDAGAAGLRSADYEVFNPADHDRAQHGADVNKSATGDLNDVAATGFSLRETLATDTSWIAAHADGIAVLDGWEGSKGALAEVALAHALGLPVMTVHGWMMEAHGVEPDRGDVVHGEGVYSEPSSPARDGLALLMEAVFTDPEPLASTDTISDLREAMGLNDPLPDGEVRLTSSTGGQKGTKQQRYGLIPAAGLDALARVYGRGAEKYDDYNWRKGYPWHLSYDALMRHAWAFWNGEDNDPEMGLPHMAAVAWHALALVHYSAYPQYAQHDDRWTPEP
jgi:Domain of unknown function (DUF5664)/Domain of unknown function (DUF4406)